MADKGQLMLSVWALPPSTIREAALDMLDVGTVSRRGKRVGKRSRNTIISLQYRARKLMRDLVRQNPERYGLERINPDEISEAMSTKELADFCGMGTRMVLSLVRGTPENGLPKPDWPLGRTLKGRGWRFKPEVAKAYAKRLLE